MNQVFSNVEIVYTSSIITHISIGEKKKSPALHVTGARKAHKGTWQGSTYTSCSAPHALCTVGPSPLFYLCPIETLMQLDGGGGGKKRVQKLLAVIMSQFGPANVHNELLIDQMYIYYLDRSPVPTLRSVHTHPLIVTEKNLPRQESTLRPSLAARGILPRDGNP